MDLHLIKRLDGHFLAAMGAAGGGGQTVRLAGAITLVNPRLRSTALNFMTLRETDPAQLAQVLGQGAAVLAGYGRPPAAYLTPLAGDLPALRERLGALGWRRHTTVSVLYRPLGPVQPEAARVRPGATAAPAPGSPLQTQIEAIGPDSLQRWLNVLTEGYEASPDASLQVRAAWSMLMAEPGDGATARYYLAHLGETPIGTGLLWQQGTIAGLYCGAVRPAFRRRGVATALLRRRIADAAESGVSLITLQTEQGSPMEQLCTARLGFQPGYRMELWLSGR